MSKTSERISDEWGCLPVPRPPCAEFILDKIRARRDQIRKTEPDKILADFMFCNLFDDGAEFGPDKPEPEYSHVIIGGAWGESVNVLKDGEKIGSVNAEIFEYIKKLGAEEAK